MEIKMPYGMCEINSKEEALRFILTACNGCDRRTLENPCNASMAMKCHEIVEGVRNEFLPRK